MFSVLELKMNSVYLSIYLTIYLNTNQNQISYISHIYIYTNLPVNAIVRPPHPQSADAQGHETFLAPSADKQTSNYDTECSNHDLSLSTPRHIYM